LSELTGSSPSFKVSSTGVLTDSGETVRPLPSFKVSLPIGQPMLSFGYSVGQLVAGVVSKRLLTPSPLIQSEIDYTNVVVLSHSKHGPKQPKYGKTATRGDKTIDSPASSSVPHRRNHLSGSVCRNSTTVTNGV